MKNTLKVLLIIVFSFIVSTVFYSVQAATANIDPKNQTGTVGENIQVIVNINAAAWNLKVSGSASDSIVGFDSNGNNVTTTKKYDVQLSKPGTYTITLSGDITDSDDTNKNINKSVTITAKEKEIEEPEQGQEQQKPEIVPNQEPSKEPIKEQNTNVEEGKLSSITINGRTYNNPNKDITVNVENEVESTEITAISSDGSAVSGVGSVALKVGSNVTKLKVNETTYIVRINRLAKIEDTPNIIDESKPDEEEPKVELALEKLEIKDFKITPEFSKDVYTYTLNIDMDKEDVEKLEINALANKENAKVEITGNEDLKEGENIINITLTVEGEEETVTYQLKVNKIVSITEVVESIEINEEKQEPENITNFSKTQRITIATIAIIGAVLGIIFAVIEYCYTNREEEHEFNEPFYIKEDEEGRLNVVGKEEEQDDNKEEKISVEEPNKLDYNTIDNSEQVGYIEDLYKNNFPENNLDFEEEQKLKKKKVKGKHF